MQIGSLEINHWHVEKGFICKKTKTDIPKAVGTTSLVASNGKELGPVVLDEPNPLTAIEPDSNQANLVQTPPNKLFETTPDPNQAFPTTTQTDDSSLRKLTEACLWAAPTDIKPIYSSSTQGIVDSSCQGHSSGDQLSDF